MRGVRAVTISTLAVVPLVLVLLPLTMVRPLEPPEIPDGAVQSVAPVGAVGLPRTAFEVLDGGVYVGVDGEQITVGRIAAFLERYSSPMAPYATEIVGAGLRYGVDPRLIVAISGTESTFGKFAVDHNAWGWDAPNGLTRWPDWPTAIDNYTRLFADGYRSRDPDVIGPRYCPDCDRWPYTTRLFFSMI